MFFVSVILGRLSGAFLLNCELFALTLLFALPLGLVVAFGSMSRCRVLSGAVKTFVWVIRGTPLMLQIMFIYYGLPLMLNVQISDFPAAILAFVANYAAYFAEIFRGGIQSIPKGQYEDAKVLGFPYRQTMWHIVLPQVVKRVIPPLGNEFIALLKDSSLVSVIGFEELTRRGQLIIAKTYGSLEIWFSVAIIYLVMTLSISRLVAYLEKRYNTDDRH